MNALQFDDIVKALETGAHRRGVLGGLMGGVLAVLGARRGTLAHHKPGHCAKSDRCKGRGRICRGAAVHCDAGPGTGCSCILSVEGCPSCVDENTCGPSCASSEDCATYGPGAVCEAPGCGNCELTCMLPCPV